MYGTMYDSPLGKLLLTCREDGLTGIWYERKLLEYRNGEEHPILQQTKLWLDSYFRGENPAVEIPMVLEGTEFQQQVWNLLLTIPYGRTGTYGDIALKMAELLGKKNMSAQAVGQAVGKNPVSILIPCHRVVGSNGKLTGYAGGIHKKIWLLRHEGRQIRNDIVI